MVAGCIAVAPDVVIFDVSIFASLFKTAFQGTVKLNLALVGAGVNRVTQNLTPWRHEPRQLVYTCAPTLCSCMAQHLFLAAEWIRPKNTPKAYAGANKMLRDKVQATLSAEALTLGQ